MPTIEDIVAFRAKLEMVAVCILHDSHLAEDAASDAIVDAIQHRSQWYEIRDLEAWLVKLVQNRANWIRRRQRIRVRVENPNALIGSDKRRRTGGHGYSGGDGMKDLPYHPTGDCPMEELADALDQMDAFRRQTIIDQYFLRIPDAEIARRDRISESRVRGMLKEAMDELRRIWSELHPE